ncbi:MULTISPECIES: hypothetical protein [unclassified Novosphingobium]|uniref:hypothetical protein n=1 Tax=unclassified Novosphingobium TaxID=2644732 RepID=UPI00135C6FF1|nr:MULTISPECIES: hypothetical protein [unclassified Novosphingobium]
MGDLPGGSTAGGGQRVASVTGGYAALIRTTLTRRGISARALLRAGVISERTRRIFDKKLSGGHLTISEMNAITSFLGINPMRALIAVAYMDDPTAYFDPCCEVLSAYNEQLVAAMTERAAALSGDFTVINRTLHHCAAHVERISSEIVEQQERTRRWLERDTD